MLSLQHTWQLCELFFIVFFAGLCASIDANYPLDFHDVSQNYTETRYIPKTAHFVLSQAGPARWDTYAAIRSAHDRLSCDQIILWVPKGEPASGGIWDDIMDIPNVVQEEIEMPDTVYGNPVSNLAHVSDVVRLKVLYLYGGIYMDMNLIALRSADPIIFAPETKSTVLANERDRPTFMICNALIMAKRGASFLQRWMRSYSNFDDKDWIASSQALPSDMIMNGDREVTALGQKPNGWFYPSWFYRGQAWFGKSYHDINVQYGQHLWHFNNEIEGLMTPHVARTVDTPIFCAMRKLFDNVGNDSYYAMEMMHNPNCTSVWMRDLVDRDDIPFSAYEMQQDTEDIKWVDSSGNHLHGWAPIGTTLQTLPETDKICRRFDAKSFANLPVPVDYDARVGTISMKFQLDPDVPSDLDITLISLVYDVGIQESRFNVDIRKSETVPDWDEMDARSSIPIYADRWHQLTISWDYDPANPRKIINIDNQTILDTSVPPQPLPARGRYFWINGKNEFEKVNDNGFRGCIEYMRFYDAAVPTEADAQQPLIYEYPPFDSLANKKNSIDHSTTYQNSLSSSPIGNDIAGASKKKSSLIQHLVPKLRSDRLMSSNLLFLFAALAVGICAYCCFNWRRHRLSSRLRGWFGHIQLYRSVEPVEDEGTYEDADSESNSSQALSVGKDIPSPDMFEV